MNYKTLTEVSESIRSFYIEEVRQEQDGTKQEEYTYLDESGDEQVAYKTVPNYIDITYIVENKRYDLKSWNDVEDCITNAQGKKDSIVDYYIEKAIEFDKFKFHDEWIKWNDELGKLQKEKEDYIEPAEEGIVQTDYDSLISYHITKEPIETTETISNWKLVNYEILRQAEYGSWEEQMERIYDGVQDEHILAIKNKYPKG